MTAAPDDDDPNSDVFEQDDRYYQYRSWKKIDGRWTLIPDLLAQDRRLPGDARWAYVLLLSASHRQNGGESGWVEYPEEWLARDLGVTAKTVRAYLNRLQDLGYLLIDKEDLRLPDGRKTPKSYLVYEPDEIDYVVEITRAQALNHLQPKRRQRRAGQRPIESTVGSEEPDSDAEYRHLRKYEKPPTTNQSLVTINKSSKERAASSPGETAAESAPPGEESVTMPTRSRESVDDVILETASSEDHVDDETTKECPHSPGEEQSHVSSLGSVTDSSSVAAGDRHLNVNNDNEEESKNRDTEEIQQAIDDLRSRGRYPESSLTRLAEMSLDEIVEIARRDPDSKIALDRRSREDDSPYWVKIAVSLAEQFLR